ncbi:hypothetical protein LTS10_012814 [Elasticomyces elasticus]|nr:hypothetical protein LTS10_012814 [Elasticomyces elasticus]
MPVSTTIHVQPHVLALTRDKDEISTIGCSREVLECILAITNLVYDLQVLSLDPVLRYRRINELERRLRLHQRIGRETGTVQADGRDSKELAVIRLYQMAALIYLDRIGHESSSEIGTTFNAAAVNEGLELLACVDVREVPWPLFVIGCEAATDVQRKRVLGIMNIEMVGTGVPTPQRMMEAFWIQDDLDTTRALTYITKMSGVISTLSSLPSFARTSPTLLQS